MTWKNLFKRALCVLVYCGHKTRDVGNHKECTRCGEKFFNVAKVVHKHKRLRHNVYGKKYFN